MTIKLNDTQLVLLSAASQRHNGFVLQSDAITERAFARALNGLIKNGLVAEHAPDHESDFDRGETHKPNFVITPTGLTAIGVPGNTHEAGEDKTRTARQRPEALSPDTQTANDQRPPTKQARIIAMLSREEGATLDDLIAATGWLPHTTRAALTGLRQKGFSSSARSARIAARSTGITAASRVSAAGPRDEARSHRTHSPSRPRSRSLRDLDLAGLQARWRSLDGPQRSPRTCPGTCCCGSSPIACRPTRFGDLDKATRPLSRQARPGQGARPRSPANRSPLPGAGQVQARHAADAGVGRRPAPGHGARRGLCLERHDLSQPVAGGPRHHRHPLERPALLRRRARLDLGRAAP